MPPEAFYKAGKAARCLLWLGSALVVVIIMTPRSPLVIAGLLLGARAISYVAQMLGSLVTAFAVRAEVREFRFGTTRPAIRFRVRHTQVSLGFPSDYWIQHGLVPVGRHVAIILSGSLADLALVGIVLALPLPQATASSLTVLFVSHALEYLMPTRTKDGLTTEGAQLLELQAYRRLAAVLRDLEDFVASRDSAAPASDRTDRVLAAYRDGMPIAQANAHILAMMLRQEGRIAELMELHAQLPTIADGVDEAEATRLAELERAVMSVPGVAVAEADRAVSRLERLPKFSQLDGHASFVTTLALARLRQDRFADVEPLCADALAADLEPGNRAAVLATVVLARRALGRPYRDLLAEAVSLSPNEDLVAEAAAPRESGRVKASVPR
jgi:hypothetical protein